LHWDFGVADSISDQSILFNPSYTYPKKEIYTARLDALNSPSGCTHFWTVSIDLKEVKADFKLDHKTGCNPQTLAVTNLSQDAVSYKFKFPGADKDSSIDVNPVFKFSKGLSTTGTLICKR
jgi:PKD repeat protein